MPTVYVNPYIGRDRASGSEADPLKTIAEALQKATAGTTVQLASATYSSNNGEKFPLVVPSGVKLVGNEAKKGNGYLISGSGEYISPSFARQNIALRLDDGAELCGVSVTNSASRGTAVWVESTSPRIANNTFASSAREGVFITGTAKAIVVNNVFSGNSANGISCTRNAKGEIRGNVFQKTGYGMTVGDTSAPLISGNKFIENRCGLVISGDARPVLRKNYIKNNAQDGITVIAKALPDLGTSENPGENIILDNGGYDLQSTSNQTIISVGNQLNPAKVKGTVEFVTSEVPLPNPNPSETPPVSPPVSPPPDAEPPSSTPPPVRTTLTDIRGHWAAGFIQAMVDRQWISGFPDNTFKPDESLTRAQYAAIVAKAFDERFEREASQFSDINADFWAFEAIVKANRMGFLSGFPNGTFRPNDKLTRVQAFVSLVNGANLRDGNTNLLGYYRDRAQIPSYATEILAIATHNGLVVNYPELTELNPMREITRAEVAAVIYQTLVAKGRAEAIASPYIVAASGLIPEPLSDIQGHWAQSFIVELVNRGILNGFPDGTFKPQAPMTRVQYAALLSKAFDPSPKRESANFQDVPDTYWGYLPIQKAYRGGFLSGYTADTFKPNENVQRIQIVLSLVNGLGLSGGDSGSLYKFADKDEIHQYARDAVVTAVRHRLIVNYPNQEQLEPRQQATRAEVAAMVYQALVATGQVAAIDSPYIVSA